MTDFLAIAHTRRGYEVLNQHYDHTDADLLAQDIVAKLDREALNLSQDAEATGPYTYTITLHIYNVDQDGGEQAVHFDSYEIGGK